MDDAYDRLFVVLDELEHIVDGLEVDDPDWDEKMVFFNTRLTQIQDQIEAHKRDSS